MYVYYDYSVALVGFYNGGFVLVKFFFDGAWGVVLILQVGCLFVVGVVPV
jgi:hypothetical protein